MRRFIAELEEDWEDTRVEIDVPLGWIGDVRDGRIVYARFFSDPGEAREAAGVRD